MTVETITVSMSDLARLETSEQAAAAAPALAERDRAVQALERAGLIRPLTPDRVERYTRLAPEERESVRRELAARRFSPPLSEQIIQDRGA
ncbi:MAG: hypothetical protein NT169_08415 [Chloroflexi bacterium]|nr:hypothetical protein [Chloroflexota bacterium]